MENNELAKVSNNQIIVRTVDDLGRVGKMMAMSGYFTDARDAAQASVKIMAGMEMGFGAFASMTGIYIIQGKPSVGANLMAAAVKSNPKYDYRVRKNEDTECVIEFFERVDGKTESIGISRFTAAEAKKANVKNMDKFPRNMLFARAMSNGIRWYCPDVFYGSPTYTPEELGAEVDDEGYVTEMPRIVPESAEIQEAEATPIDSTPVQQKATANQKKAFDEVEYLTTFSHPQNIMKMSYNNAKTYTSDTTGQLYDEMTTKELYGHWTGLAKQLSNPELNQDQKDGIGMKISAICAIMWHRKQEIVLAEA